MGTALKILYIAYSCSPSGGSEEAIGWNVPFCMAILNPEYKIYVITKIKHKNEIVCFLQHHNIYNLYFYFVDVGHFYSSIFRGKFYSGRLNPWLNKAYKFSTKLCQKKNIDIVHQINPIEFRSIGNFGKLPIKGKILGPIGGGEFIPKALSRYLYKDLATEIIRKVTNIALKRKARQRIEKYSYVMFANDETRSFLDEKEHDIVCEIGVSNIYEKSVVQIKDSMFHLLFVGRLVTRKGLDFLFDCLVDFHADYNLTIIGSGLKEKHYKKVAEQYKLGNRIIFKGTLEHNKLLNIYSQYDALIMPSLRETTGTVILEAISAGIPVITYKGFGGNYILDESCAYLYYGQNFSEISSSVIDNITKAINDKKSGNTKRDGALARSSMYLWKNKCELYKQKYLEVLEKEAGNE